MTRCDLHVHSAASTGNDEWFTRFFGCPESYAEPARQYDLCKARGMTLVTLTDHDTIAGGLTLLDRPDFFLSEEVTAIFPENGCVVHVLAWNITPAQHDEIQSRRRNVYRLCEYLNSAGIAHGLAHPLLSPNWQLDADVLEKLLVLFGTFESVNGLTDQRIESDLTTLLERLTPEILASLARKHDLGACRAHTARKAFTAGSDDHVHRRCGTIYTEVSGPDLGPAPFLRRCMEGDGRAVGRQAHLHTMAVCAKSTAYRHFERKAETQTGFHNPLVEMADVLAGRRRRPSAESDGGADFVAALLDCASKADLDLGPDRDVLRIPMHPTDEDDARIVGGISRLCDRLLQRGVEQIVDGAGDFDLYRIFGALRDLAGGLASAAPLLFAADHFGKQEIQVRRLWAEWRAFPLPERPTRLAVFTDSLAHVDGVSSWCERFVEEAQRAEHTVLLPYCGDLPAHLQNRAPFHALPAVTSFPCPFYDGYHVQVPSPLEAILWLWRERVSHVELATPGPMGLVGLVAAKLLRLPVTASYHTELPALARAVGAHDGLVGGIRKYLGWFYARADRVFAFSPGSRDNLIAMGLRPDKLTTIPAGVDPTDFSPAHRTRTIFPELGIEVGDRPVVLSVGRISQEKNLPAVIEAVERLQRRRPAPLLVIAGEGPDFDRLKAACASKPFVHLVGLVRGTALRRLYASAQVFAFAGEVDTLGLVNLEAMASGLPVLVPRGSCIAALFRADDELATYDLGGGGLGAAIRRLLDEPTLAARLSEGGRKSMVARWKKTPLPNAWDALTAAR